MKYKLYQVDKNNEYQPRLVDMPHPYPEYDMFGYYAIIDEEEATLVKLRYPHAHIFLIRFHLSQT